QEGAKPGRLVLLQRKSRLRDALCAPDAEADVRLLGQVAGDPERLALVARVGAEELDQLAPLWRRAPGAEAIRLIQLAAALRADAHLPPPLGGTVTPVSAARDEGCSERFAKRLRPGGANALGRHPRPR